MVLTGTYFVGFFFIWLNSPLPPFPVGQGLIIHEVSRSHTTTHHSRQDSSGGVISSQQRPLPDNTHPPVGFEPTISAGQRPQTCALDSSGTGTDSFLVGLQYLTMHVCYTVILMTMVVVMIMMTMMRATRTTQQPEQYYNLRGMTLLSTLQETTLVSELSCFSSFENKACLL